MVHRAGRRCGMVGVVGTIRVVVVRFGSLVPRAGQSFPCAVVVIIGMVVVVGIVVL
jgi:hypothetical protein